MSYSKAISAKVTAYTPYDAGCTGITATGTKAGYGTVAVDPRVIPLGSKVYIPGLRHSDWPQIPAVQLRATV